MKPLFIIMNNIMLDKVRLIIKQNHIHQQTSSNYPKALSLKDLHNMFVNLYVIKQIIPK